jgi:hypothetical protein
LVFETKITVQLKGEALTQHLPLCDILIGWLEYLTFQSPARHISETNRKELRRLMISQMIWPRKPLGPVAVITAIIPQILRVFQKRSSLAILTRQLDSTRIGVTHCRSLLFSR